MSSSTKPTEKTSSRKRRHISLAAQVNMLIILITLSVSLLMAAINANTYYRAMIDPPTEKLEKADVDEFIPYLKYFSLFLGTEEMQKARESVDDSAGDFIDWMETIPSFTSDDPDTGRRSLFEDHTAFDIDIKEKYLDAMELDICCVEVVKDGTVYRVTYNDYNESGYTRNGDFGREISLFDYSPTDYLYPVMTKVGSQYLLLRCICLDLDGCEGRVWLVYDETGAVHNYRAFLTRNILYILLLTVAASVVSIWLLRRYVTKPISSLVKAAKQFEPEEDGTYSAAKISTVDISSGNELGDLSREIQLMQARIVENTESLKEMTAEKERISTELDLAARIQKSMLPCTFPPFPEREEFELFASMTPAEYIGGDFYDFFMIDGDHLALVIADVSGKGIPGALFMMISKVILKNNAMIGRSAGEILEITNALICANNKLEMFVTVWLGILEISTGKIRAANAGHEYPAVSKNGCFKLLKDSHSFVIGGMDGARYKEYDLQLEKGDKIFVYTDGVAEAINEAREMFGTERMIDALNRRADLSPKEIIAGVKSTVDAFAGSEEQFDDMTMLCLEYKGG